MPKYSNKKILSAIKGSRGFYSVIAKRLGCSRNIIPKRIKQSTILTTAYDEEMEDKGDWTEIKLEQIASEKIPIEVPQADKNGNPIYDSKNGRISTKIIEIASKGSVAVNIFYAKTKLKDRGFTENLKIDTNIVNKDIGIILKEFLDKMGEVGIEFFEKFK